ncbi:MAG TPA: secretin N-terminal domain-containing protein [Thermoanaerobaculaceae bacterium]|nr:secretin N-terminal domain-containing protein [Thermoanaerobaculaceae bacterium]
MGRWLLAAFLAASAVPALAQELEVRVFELQHRAVRDAAPVIEPLLSPDGSILLQPRKNAVTVRDRPEVLRRISEAMLRWDTEPVTYRVRVSLLRVAESGPPFDPSDPVLKEISAGLTKLFGFRSCTEVDTLRVTAKDGDLVESEAGSGHYWVRFTLTASPQDRNRIQLKQFEVLHQPGSEKSETMRPVLTTAAISLLAGQTSVLGLSREEKASQALVVVLVAEPGAPQ